MRDDQGFTIQVNGLPRTFRDVKATAYEAALFIKVRARGSIVEIVDRSTGAKVIVLEDGRAA